MIKNETQYRITRAHVRRFEDALAELVSQARPANISPRLWQAQRDAAESQLADLPQEVAAYEQLHSGKNKGIVLETLEDLPKALIQARIASGLTQQALATRLGVKTQQVQRDEATEYASASFARIRKVMQALGLRTPRPVRLVRH